MCSSIQIAVLNDAFDFSMARGDFEQRLRYFLTFSGKGEKTMNFSSSFDARCTSAQVLTAASSRISTYLSGANWLNSSVAIWKRRKPWRRLR